MARPAQTAAEFTALFDRYGLSLIRFARSRLPDPSLAEDIVHDVFLNIWKNRDTLSITNASIESYLYQAVRHRIGNVYRSEQRTIVDNIDSSTELIPDPGDATNDSDTSALEQAVIKALATLPERCRQVFEFHRLRGLSYPEISRVLGLAEPTVRRHMARAVEALREALKEWS